MTAVRTYLSGRVTVHHGDSRDVLKGMADASVDSVCTDPPYALVSIVKRFGGKNAAPTKDGDVYARSSAGFMNQSWDTGETAFAAEFWAEVLRVLKPGGHVLAFSGTRTYHRLACAIEDAGFEIRDMVGDFIASDTFLSGFFASLDDEQRRAFIRVIDESLFGGMAAWTFGSGFPKSHNQGNGWGTALKPALEPIVLARRPLIGTVAANVLAHGTGALNIDGCRISVGDEKVGAGSKSLASWRRAEGRDDLPARPPATREEGLGRWPANVIHDGSEEVLAVFPDAPGQGGSVSGGEPSSLISDIYKSRKRVPFATPRDDSGSAARFFYTAKADGLDRLGSKHPTVKPVDLMRYLCRLVTPPGGRVLDPFAGTGTTGEAAWLEGFSATLIEREAAYVADIERRMRLCLAGPEEKARAIIKAKGKIEAPGPLFSEVLS